MEIEQTDEPCITIYFDNDNNIRLSKSYLIKHSQYFEVMFCGNFKESQSGDQIRLKDINYEGFMSVIESLKHNRIIYDGLEDLLLVLETSQLLQFADIIWKSIILIKKKYLFTVDAIPIFSIAFKLGLKELYEIARVIILYNFKTFLSENKERFYELNEGDLQLLLHDNQLNVDNETDILDLVIEWCSETNNYDIEYDVAVGCVHFSSMDKNQLNYCISKTNNIHLQNTIKQYMNFSNKNEELMGLSLRPVRCVPNVLCAVKNEDGVAFIYRWDWSSLKFTKFLRLDPLPQDTTGYLVLVKEMDIFVIGGEISFGRGIWNEAGWKYSLLSKEWKEIAGFVPTKRRHGVGHFCGNELYLVGGITKHRLPNELIEMFTYDKESDTLDRCKSYLNHYFANKIDRKFYTCLEFKGRLSLITLDTYPRWLTLRVDRFDPPFYTWDSFSLNLEDKVICAAVYLDYVYILAYNKQRNIALYCFCPTNQSCQELTCFEAEYDQDSTMCAFNINKAMVFANNTLEYYSIDNNVYKKFTTQMDSG